MTMTLESIGFTQEEIQNKVIDSIVDQLLSSTFAGEDGEEFDNTSRFKTKLDEAIKLRIDSAISALAEKHVLPNVTQYIENLTLQKTNEWGEAKGDKLTFIEYLVQRAEAYLNEKVNHEGKGKAEANGYSWDGRQTRITYLVNSHLHYSIESAMKTAMQNANSLIAGGIQETVKLKLKQLTDSLVVGAKVSN